MKAFYLYSLLALLLLGLTLPVVSNAQTVCVSDTTTLTDATPGGVWSTAGVTIATIDSFSGLLTGISAGTATISYSVGSTHTTRVVTVDPLPYPGVLTGLDSVCVGYVISLSPSVSGGSWGSTNGNASVSAGFVLGLHQGIDTITYKVTALSCTASATKTVVINTLPGHGTISGPDSLCIGSPALFTESVTGGMWTSSHGGSIDSTGLFTPTSSGPDTIFYIVSNPCGTSVASKIITVVPIPASPTIVGVSGVCLGDTIMLSHFVPGGTWLLSNANATVSASGIVTGVSAGKDTVSYIFSTFCGVDTVTKVITIPGDAHAGVITGPTAVCVGSAIFLSDSIAGGVWASSNATAAISGSTFATGVTPGIDTITYTFSNACGSDQVYHILNIYDVPARPTITRTGNELSVPAGYSAYLWIRNDIPIPGATTTTYNAPSLANYYVIVTNPEGCGIISYPQTITELICDVNDLRIYPNPAKTLVYIDWCKPVTARISAMDGKTMEVKNSNQVDLSTLPDGIYHLNLSDAAGHHLLTRKITKSH